MLKANIDMAPRVPRIPLALLCGLVLLCGLLESEAGAQEPGVNTKPPLPGAAGAPAPPVVDPPPPAEALGQPPTAGTSAGASTAGMAADVAALKAALEETRAKLEQVQIRQDEAEATALAHGEEEVAPKEAALNIYGFADMGVQHVWLDKGSLIANVAPSNSTSFVIGNVNLYFDAQPIEDWRGLIEVRFTNAPLGDTLTYGGIAGKYQRKDTFSYDPHATLGNAPMWAGAVVLERAWIEWNEHQLFKLRLGNWFTPFGIWNEDHGSPTLIATALPQFILQRLIPIRQTGLMGYGNTFLGEWELGYMLTFSNGRQELSNFNFEDKFGYGGRLYLRRDTGALNSTFGISYFTGTTSDRAVNLVAINPVTFATPTVWEYNEHVLGADVSIDIDSTRIRAEAMVRRQTFTRGLRALANPNAPGVALQADRWQHNAYLLVAHQLPWAGLEPLVRLELFQGPDLLADAAFAYWGGLNIHFNPAVQLKTEAGQVVFFDWLYDQPGEASLNNITQILSRLVLAF